MKTTAVLRKDGHPFASKNNATTRMRNLGLEDSHTVETYGDGYAIFPKALNEERVTLQEGDYIATADLSEDDYHKVAQAFMAAGAVEGEYPNIGYMDCLDSFGWSEIYEKLWHYDIIDGGGFYRQLTLSQILNATNAGNNTQGENNKEETEVKEFKVGDKVVLNGHRNDGDDFHCGYCGELKKWEESGAVITVVGDAATEGCLHVSNGIYTRAVHPSEIDRAGAPDNTQTTPMHLTDRLEAALTNLESAQAEYDALLDEHKAAYPKLHGLSVQVDIPPEEWRVGDVVECVKNPRDAGSPYCDGAFVVGEKYTISDQDGSDSFRYEGGKLISGCYEMNHCFKFYRRP